MIVEKIEEYLKSSGKSVDEALRYEVEKMAGWVFKRQFMTDEEATTKGTIRLSSVGRCPRQVAYAYHGFEKNGKEMDVRAKLVFWTGDLVELTVVNLAKLAGCQLAGTGFNQLHLKFQVNGSFISGHPDGILYEDKQQFLLEVKSMSSYGFEKFERGEIDSAYLAQVNAYMEALGLTRCIFVALNKDSGVMKEQIIEKDPEIVSKIRETLLTVIHSTPESLPEQPKEYGPDEKGFLMWNCRYCAYWKTCRPNAEEVLVKNSYKLKEKQNGNVLSRQNEASGEQDQQMGSGVRQVPPDGRKPRRTKKDNSVVGVAQTSRGIGLEGRSKGENIQRVHDSFRWSKSGI